MIYKKEELSPDKYVITKPANNIIQDNKCTLELSLNFETSRKYPKIEKRNVST